MPEPLDLLPFSPDAEGAIIGSLLIDPSATAVAQTLVRPEDFHDEELGEVYRACLKLGGRLDYVTLTELLHSPETEPRIAALIAGVPTAMHLEHYCAIVHRDAVRRRAIRAAQEIVQKAYRSADTDSLLAHVQAAAAALLDGRAVGDRCLTVLGASFYDTVELWYKNPIGDGECRFLSTGFPQLDTLTDGLVPRTLTVIAGRPGIGKSALAFEIARRVGVTGKNVLIFSLEMSNDQILHRWASAMSNTPMRSAQKGRGDAVPFVHSVLQLAAHGNVWIDDTPALTPSQVRTRALARHLQNPLALMVLDHGGEMESDSKKATDNLAYTEGRKTKAMKDLAKELSCPVLLVLQLNRGPEGRANKRPTMAELRDSGAHEQTADVILGLYRESYYDPRCENPNLFEVAVLKNRQGPSGGTINLWYEPEYQRFSGVDLSKRRIEEEI